MDGKSESRADEDNETMSINTSEGTYRGQSSVSYNQSTSLANGATAQVLTKDTSAVQEPSIKTQRQDGATSSNPLTLTIADVSGNIASTMNNTTTVDGTNSQSNSDSNSNIVGQNVVNVLQQDYLSGSSSGQYVSTSEQHNDSSVTLGVDEMEQDEKDRDDSSETLREQDRFLPIANVARIMKKSVPKTGKIAKDAKECVQECVSEFISFITSEASERCHQEKRKTINGEDILFAMTTLGFDQYGDPLKLYLQKYRESMKGEKGAMGSVSEGEIGDDGQSITHYSSAPMHPSMIPPDQASALYSQSYQPQMQQSLHFQSM